MLRLSFLSYLVILFIFSACKDKKTDLSDTVSILPDKSYNYHINPALLDAPVESDISSDILYLTGEKIKNKHEFPVFKKVYNGNINKLASNIGRCNKYLCFITKNWFGSLNLVLMDKNKFNTVRIPFRLSRELMHKSKQFKIFSRLNLDTTEAIILSENGTIVKLNIDPVQNKDVLKVEWKQKINDLVEGDALIDSQKIFIKSIKGAFYALSIETGEFLWSSLGGEVQTIYKNKLSFMFYDKYIISLGPEPTISVFDTESGVKLGDSALNVLRSDDSFLNILGGLTKPKLLIDGVILATTFTDVFLFDTQSGEVFMQSEISKVSSISQIGNFVLLSTLENKLFLVNKYNFDIKWYTKDDPFEKKFGTKKSRYITKVIISKLNKGSVIVVSNYGEMILISLKDGELLSSSKTYGTGSMSEYSEINEFISFEGSYYTTIGSSVVKVS